MPKPDEFYRDLETLLELDSGTLSGSEELTDPPWDSMSIVAFIAMADEKYGVIVSPRELQNAGNVGDLLALVSGRQ